MSSRNLVLLGNTISGNLAVDNKAWGLLATGWRRGSTIGFNTIVDTRAATGLVTFIV